MVEETLMVGDTEVVVTNTDDGFEVEEVEEEPEGTYIRFQSQSYGGCGCEIPIGSDFIVEDPDKHSIHVAWHREDNIDDSLSATGYSSFLTDEQRGEYDGHASVDPDYTEIVQY